ncbi:MAG: signal peptidase I [Candidatus Atabeyarchaeum deiterrae]
MKKSQMKEAAKIILLFVIIGGGVFGANVALQVAMGTPIPVVVVVSTSMVPTLNVGDVCVIRNVSADQYVVGNHTTRTGDIIVIDVHEWEIAHNLPTDPVIHRIIDRIYDNGTYWFRTQGDNNQPPDGWDYGKGSGWVDQDRVYGKVILTIPWIGYIFLFLRDGGVLIVIPILALIIVLIFREEASKMREKAKSGSNLTTLVTGGCLLLEVA